MSSTAAAALALLVPLVAGAAAPGYSHTAQYISELGAMGMPHGGLVSLGGFLPIGLFVGLCLATVATRAGETIAARAGYVLLASVAAAYVASAFARCDFGCPALGSSSQQIHNLFGVAEYLAGSAGLVLVALGVRGRGHGLIRAMLLLGAVATFLGFAAMVSPGLAVSRGLAQRVAETALFGSLLLIGWRTARPSVA